MVKVKPEYIVAALAGGAYSVAKFQGSAEPTAVYTLFPRTGQHMSNTPFDQRRYKCDCPAGRHHIHLECKHIDMIEEFRATGRNTFEG